MKHSKSLLNCARLLTVVLIYINFTGCSGDRSAALTDYNKGKAAYATKKLQLAKTYFQKAVDQDSSFINGWVMLGKTAFFLKDYNNAKKHFDHAIDLAKYHAEANYYLFRISLLKRTDTKYSIKYLQNILEVDPSDARAHYSLAETYKKMGNIKKALYHYNSALQDEVMLARVRYSYANTLLQAGLKDRAKNVLQPALAYQMHAGLKKEIKTLWKKIK